MTYKASAGRIITILLQFDAGHWELSRLVWDTEVPRLLQVLQRPHPHHEGGGAQHV